MASNVEIPTRNLLAAAVALAVVSLAGAGSAGAGTARGAVRLPPEVAAQMLAQLEPGSGVIPGYRRPDLDAVVEVPVAAPINPGAGVVLGVGVPVVQVAPPPLVYEGRVRTGQPVPVERVSPPRYRQAAAPAPARPGMDPRYLPAVVAYDGAHAPGTIVVDTRTKYLYLVEKNHRARRYGVGVGKEGFAWKGTHPISRKAEWPGWTPPREMIARERRKGRILPAHMDGGPGNPLGARALYIGSTLYRIHGTNQPWTIGRAVSSGCIRMRNQDVEDLYDRVGVGTTVVVL